MAEFLKITEVYQTKDYSLFKRLNGNREIKGSSVKKIMDSIQTVGWKTVPIIVNENMEICDGQHRFEACRKLGLPIQFLIAPGLTIADCTYLNMNQKNWTAVDWCRMYAENGNENYQRLLQINSESSLGIWVVYNLAKNKPIASGYSMSKFFKTGNMVLTQEEADSFYEVKDFSELIADKIRKDESGKETRIYCTTVCYAYRHPRVDRARLEEIVANKFDQMESYSTVEGILKNISKLYNYRLPQDKKISFHGDYANEFL